MLLEVERVERSWAILFFGMSTPWMSLRQATRSKLFPGRSTNPYPVSPVEMNLELQSLGMTLTDSTWVLPYITGGMVLNVHW